MFSIYADNLPRFMQCGGSRAMPADFDNREPGDQTVRNEGNATHWLAQQVEQGHITLQHASTVPTIAPNGVLLTPEMIEHVGDYLATFGPGESECETSWRGMLGDIAYQIAARSDRVEWDGTTVRVRDFKYGWRIVEPDENWTLIAHAIGFIERNNITSCNVELVIHQPRPYHPDGKVREWRTNYAQLQRYKAQIVARIAEGPQTLETGPLCGTCHAAASCPAFRRSNYNAIDAVENSVFSDTISDTLLDHELRILEHAESVLTDRKAALSELAQHRIRSGAVVGEYQLQERYGNRVWNAVLTPTLLRALTGKDLSKPATVTPAQAEKAGVPKNVVETLSHRPMIGTKLVRRSIDAKARKLLQN